MKYDNEEKDILDALEKGKMKLATPSKKEIESIKAAANSTPKKETNQVPTKDKNSLSK